MSDTPRTDALIGRNRKLDKMTDVALYLAEIAESHADLERELAAKSAEVERLRLERDTAVQMLAEWCVAVDVNGAGWDDWDEHYKDAAYRPGPLREQIDAAMTAHRELMGYAE